MPMNVIKYNQKEGTNQTKQKQKGRQNNDKQ